MSRELVLPLFDADAAEFLAGPEIAQASLLAIEEARERIWGCFFLASVAVDHDPHRLVREICDALVRASRRGVDVRLLLDDFESSVDGLPTNEVTGHYLLRHGVAVRLYESERHVSTHSKYFLFDDDSQIVGSGNLTHGAVASNLEMALQVASPDLMRWLGERFLRNWDAARDPEALS
ncbi:MAG: phospholipase D family protein [Planctomycetota bacterium]|nr:phospholipase D family protein [Planctomycetota bacterium]MDA1252010.1 phospholipase D family protein [Planctomycetota bacterium]